MPLHMYIFAVRASNIAIFCWDQNTNKTNAKIFFDSYPMLGSPPKHQPSSNRTMVECLRHTPARIQKTHTINGAC